MLNNFKKSYCLMLKLYARFKNLIFKGPNLKYLDIFN